MKTVKIVIAVDPKKEETGITFESMMRDEGVYKCIGKEDGTYFIVIKRAIGEYDRSDALLYWNEESRSLELATREWEQKRFIQTDLKVAFNIGHGLKSAS